MRTPDAQGAYTANSDHTTEKTLPKGLPTIRSDRTLAGLCLWVRYRLWAVKGPNLKGQDGHQGGGRGASEIDGLFRRWVGR